MRQQKNIRWHTSNSRHKLRRQIAQSFSRSAKNRVQQFIKRSANARHGIDPLFKTSLTPCLDKVFTARQNLAENCAESRETVARWARNIRREIRQNFSRHVRAMSRQWPHSGNGNAAERPSRRLARQLALRRIWTRNVRTENLRDNSQYSRATTAPKSAQQPMQHLTSNSSDFSPSVLTMTSKNYEHTNYTNARS
jgi:hypothetical protein